MSKSTHFSGQPIYGQLINLLDKRKVLEFCETVGKERYIKHFDGWQHLPDNALCRHKTPGLIA